MCRIQYLPPPLLPNEQEEHATNIVTVSQRFKIGEYSNCRYRRIEFTFVTNNGKNRTVPVCIKPDCSVYQTAKMLEKLAQAVLKDLRRNRRVIPKPKSRKA